MMRKIKRLLERRDPQEELFRCARGGDASRLRKLLERRPRKLDVNQLDEKYGATPLYYACQRGHTEVVRLLLQHPMIMVNAVAHCWSCSHIIIGNDEMFPSKNYKAPLHVACARGHGEIVALLLRHPAIDVNMFSNGLTPLHTAVRNGQLHIIQLLLAVPSLDVNASDKAGMTALHMACELGQLQIAEALSAHPAANVNIEDKDGNTPLFIACRTRDLPLINLLLSHQQLASASSSAAAALAPSAPPLLSSA